MQTLDAEYGVLGCLMVYGSEAAEVLTKVEECYFPTPQLRTVYKAVREAIESGNATDAVSIKHATGDAVGIELAIDIVESHSTIQNALSYCEIIHDKYSQREMTELGFRLTNADYPLSAEDAVLLTQKTLMRIAKPEAQNSEDLKAGIKRVVKDIQNRFDSNEMSGVPTGFKIFDDASDGLQKQTMTVLAAVPGGGKTTMAMQMAMNAAKTVPVLFFSMEMGLDQMVKRMLCNIGGIHMSTMANGRFKDSDWPKLTTGVNWANNLNDNLIIDCNPSVSPAYIRQKANEVILKRGSIGLVVIDYFRLMESPKGEKTLEATTSNALGVNRLKKDLDCPIIILAQVNKDTVKGGHRPNQGSLDWGQQLGRDADNILFLYTNDTLKADKVVHFYSDKTRSMEAIDCYLDNRLEFNRLEEREYPYTEQVQTFNKPSY